MVREYIMEHLADDDAVLAVDETGFLKQGKASCGEARQYTGSAGKITNCQIGLFATWAASPVDTQRLRPLPGCAKFFPAIGKTRELVKPATGRGCVAFTVIRSPAFRRALIIACTKFERGLPFALVLPSPRLAIFTKSAAMQYARENIRINSVHPGYADTPLTLQRFSDPAVRQVLLDRTPMGRLGTALDVANRVLFLASDEASWAAGSELVIDGGMTAQ